MSAKIITSSLIAVSLTLGSFSLTYAGGHSPVEKRQTAMKAVGKNTKVIGDMLKGSTAFDAAGANAALVAMRDAVASFDSHFPEGSEAANSEAGPKIWSQRADFTQAVGKFQSDLNAAVSANAQDKAGIGKVFGQAASNCKSCHEAYRVKK